MRHSKAIEDLIDRECAGIYTSREARAAYRAGMSTAAAVCDYVAAEFGERNIIKREKQAAAKLCGDVIDGLRGRIHVP